VVRVADFRAEGTGDELGFESLFDREAGPLLAFLTLRTGDRALAEDVLADAFERVWRKQGSFDACRGSETNWLYSIAINLATDQMRRRLTEEQSIGRIAAGSPATKADQFDAIADRDMLGRAAAGLSPEEREAVALRFGADLTMPEISALVDEPLSTVEGRIYRALGKLRSAIAE